MMKTSMQRDLSFRGVIYGVFQQSVFSPRLGSTVIALVAAHRFAGTTYFTKHLAESLNSELDASSVVLDCRSPTEINELNTKPSRISEVETTTAVHSHANSNWRSSRDLRISYLNNLRERYSSVLIDCPSLKESTDILAFAPLVDGIILVVEANKTTKNQIAFLERTIEGAGGKVLGHILNKRTYPIPAWAYNTLESWGI